MSILNGKPRRFIVKALGKKSGVVREHIVTVDSEDAHLLRNSYWIIGGSQLDVASKYVIRHTPNGNERLSHVVLGVPREDRVQHINGDSLDCRKQNLLCQSERTRELPE